MNWMRIGAAGAAAWLVLPSVALAEIDAAALSNLRLSQPEPYGPLEGEPYDDEIVYDIVPKHSEYYFRISGLAVEQLEDGVTIPGGSDVGFDFGGGVSVGFGYRFPGLPLSVEVEYAFRYVDVDESTSGGDGDISLHTFAVNGLFDYPDLIGPVGVYAGIGLGATIQSFSFVSSGGAGAAGIDTGGFYWQATGGLTVSVHPQAQLFGGVRWSDAGTMEDSSVRVRAEMLSYELGVRFFF